MYLLVVSALLSLASAKVYERCELARELRDRHRVPEDQLATWVCIADRESNLNTSAIGRLNSDGSSDHGIFQISDKYWCSPGWACGIDCSSLRDDDISDDWKCVRRIHKEHQHLSGDGFNAWAVYGSYCKSSSVSDYLRGCFDGPTGDQENIIGKSWFGGFPDREVSSFPSYQPHLNSFTDLYNFKPQHFHSDLSSHQSHHPINSDPFNQFRTQTVSQPHFGHNLNHHSNIPQFSPVTTTLRPQSFPITTTLKPQFPSNLNFDAPSNIFSSNAQPQFQNLVTESTFPKSQPNFNPLLNFPPDRHFKPQTNYNPQPHFQHLLNPTKSSQSNFPNTFNMPPPFNFPSTTNSPFNFKTQSSFNPQMFSSFGIGSTSSFPTSTNNPFSNFNPQSSYNPGSHYETHYDLDTSQSS